MTNSETRKLIRYGLLCIPTLLISFNIGSVLGDAAEERYYYTPSTRPHAEMVIDEYRDNSIYLINFGKLEFNPTRIQILRNDKLVQEEELAAEEQLNIYSIDLKPLNDGIYKIIISDRFGHIVTETISHKTT